jgi:prevent-host-death family protein
MLEIDVLEAERQFEDLVERAERGEEIVITRNGDAIAKLVRAVAAPGVPVLGYSGQQD